VLKKYSRISVDPAVNGGIPFITKINLPISELLEKLSGYCDIQKLIETFPGLEKEDIEQTLHFTSEIMKYKELPLLCNEYFD
jgi:uncharacterized protein (DUF433 family)